MCTREGTVDDICIVDTLDEVAGDIATETLDPNSVYVVTVIDVVLDMADEKVALRSINRALYSNSIAIYS